jgi:hypothetical protein
MTDILLKEQEKPPKLSPNEELLLDALADAMIA